MRLHRKSYVDLVLLDAPKIPENSSRSKVGPKEGFGGLLKEGQKQVKSTQTSFILLTYFQGPPETYFWTYF